MQYREIPYNYSSFSDKEIVYKFLGKEAWDILEELRSNRSTGRSAKMLFEVLGDMWVVERNPYLQEDLINNSKRFKALIEAMNYRVQQIKNRIDGNHNVLKILQKTTHKITDFKNKLHKFKNDKKRISKALLKVTNKNNIRFDPLSRSSHATDATDWRVEYPLLVVTPDYEDEIAKIVKTCVKLGLNIIARGGGTGYTGGIIPLTDNSVMINTEKLQNISAIYQIDNHDIIKVGSGVVTKSVAIAASKQNLIFAVDPTSQDSCTIGGNIAMNAGGKKALRWGTTIDNLFSWKMIIPSGDMIEVRRLNHNFDKIQLVEEIQFKITNLVDNSSKQITVKTADIRKAGLGKDATNKFMQGIPGVQKEGCDGIITSAEFILHKPLKNINTVCLEFFGFDTKAAVCTIVSIKDSIDASDNVDLVGMEHLDYRYIKAVRYSTKADRFELPRMLLLIDISSDSINDLNIKIEDITKLLENADCEIFIAKEEQQRKIFWEDRSNTAAIAAHTNAFKINEDVVLPLHNLAEYSDNIERINMRLSLQNKLKIVTEIKDHLHVQKCGKCVVSDELIDGVIRHWKYNLDNLNDDKVFRKIQVADLIISYKNEVEKPLFNLLSGDNFVKIRNDIKEIHQKNLKQRLFIALHMHAGDGNIHTNIPVHSHSKTMLKTADLVVDEIMQLATNLGGVVSGEHGIGMTKYKYLNDKFKQDFIEYKKQIDPNNSFNTGKLMPGSGLHNAYTPSLELLEQEALILESSKIGEIVDMTKSCLRCGKCKSVCTTHIPEQNLLYSPRDKIIGANLLIEAFLYEEQTRRGISLNHFAEFDDIADHCTICHLCVKPCPVDIDYGDVSIKMREILISKGKHKNNIAAKLSLKYLNLSSPLANKISKKLLGISYKLQRLGVRFFKPFNHKQANLTIGKPTAFSQLTTIVDKALPNDTDTLAIRELLDIKDSSVIPVLCHPDAKNPETVFYFPGCGSEKLFSQIGLATLALLYNNNVRVVLPPSYLCCGYPQNANGDTELANRITTNNKILFHRIANTMNYLDIKYTLTSCGTCIDQLDTYNLKNIFLDSESIDIHQYLLKNNIKLEETTEKYLYHTPCHDPIKEDSTQVISEFMGAKVKDSERCCGEAGTFAVARPDIAKAAKARKQETIVQNLLDLEHSNENGVRILTTCPACRQGLSRYEDSTGVEAIYPIEVMAEQTLGNNWQQDFIDRVNIEKILL